MLFEITRILNPSDFIGIYNTPKLYMPFASHSSFKLSNKTFFYILLSAGTLMMALMEVLPLEALAIIPLFIIMLIVSKDGMQSEQLAVGIVNYYFRSKSGKNKKKRGKSKDNHHGIEVTPSGYAVMIPNKDTKDKKSKDKPDIKDKETIQLKDESGVINLTLNVGKAYQNTYVTVYVDERRIIRDIVNEKGTITFTLQPSIGEKIFDIHPDNKLLPIIKRTVIFE